LIDKTERDMPKSRKQVKAISTEEFHCLKAGALVAGVYNLALNASGLGAISTRFLAIGDAFQLYRLKSLKFRLHCANVSANQAAGFVPGPPDTYPASLSQVMELRSSLYQDQTQTVPTEWCTVPVEDLRGQFPWYRTIDGTAPLNEEIPGTFYVFGTGTDNYAVEFKIAVELKEPISTANTPEQLAALRARREQAVKGAAARERDRLLGIMSAVTTGK